MILLGQGEVRGKKEEKKKASRPGRKRSRHADAHSRHETVYPPASAERGQPSPPDRAAERGSAPQADSHLCSCWLWENHAGQRMGRGNRAIKGPYRLAVAGRR